MKKVFPAWGRKVLLIPVVLLFILALILFSSSNNWIALAALVGAAASLYAYRGGFYEVTTNSRLIYHDKLMHEKEIHINSIRKIRTARREGLHRSLHHDRLEILYNRYGSIKVSLSETNAFINSLKAINPRIIVENENKLPKTAPGMPSEPRINKRGAGRP